MTSAPETALDPFRQNYRSRFVGPHYNGYVHVVAISVVSLGVCAIAWSHLSHVSLAEWCTLPAAWLYANLAEYLGHRWPMHRPTRFLNRLYRGHAGEHHRYFRHDRMEIADHRDLKAVLFPPYLLMFFLGGLGLPSWYFAATLISHNVANLIIVGIFSYFINYEWFHVLYHLHDEHPLLKLPFVGILRELHTNHHDPRWMASYNFNISYPVFDLVFGTYRRRARVRPAPSAQPARRPEVDQ